MMRFRQGRVGKVGGAGQCNWLCVTPIQARSVPRDGALLARDFWRTCCKATDVWVVVIACVCDVPSDWMCM
jgi:hypothetical protein